MSELQKTYSYRGAASYSTESVVLGTFDDFIRLRQLNVTKQFGGVGLGVALGNA
jgi:hypothetical protein